MPHLVRPDRGPDQHPLPMHIPGRAAPVSKLKLKPGLQGCMTAKQGQNGCWRLGGAASPKCCRRRVGGGRHRALQYGWRHAGAGCLPTAGGVTGGCPLPQQSQPASRATQGLAAWAPVASRAAAAPEAQQVVLPITRRPAPPRAPSLALLGREALRPKILWHSVRCEVLPPHLLSAHKPHQPRILLQPLQHGGQEGAAGGSGQ